jgi:hypothetical protein
MSKRLGGLSRASLTAASFCALALTACDGEKLGPVSNYHSADCVKTAKSCSDNGVKLDGGLGKEPDAQPMPMSDAATPQADAALGADAAPEADAAPAADAAPGVDAMPELPDAMPQPDAGPPPNPFLNLNGQWHTRYSFDMSHYLFGINQIAPTLDVINQALMGHLHTGIPLLDQFIASILQMFIPPWVGTVVMALDSIANFFSDVRVTGGLMTINEPWPVPGTNTTVALDATETWTQLIIMIINNCPLGQMDPNYPACAMVPVPVAANPQAAGPLEIGVTISPFAGTLNTGVPQADFVFQGRQVRLELKKLILIIADTVVRIATNGQFMDLNSFLGSVIDCNGLAMAAYNWVLSYTPLGIPGAIAAQVAVTGACNNAISDIVNGVGGVGVPETLQFDQHGTAVDTNGDGRPEVLQQYTVPNTIDGHFTLVINAHLGGVWEGLP